MYRVTDQQVEYILNDIRRSGVEMEDLQLNLLDHICCKVEQELEDDGNFERFYRMAVKELVHESLYEVEEETINLLKFKHYYFMKKLMMISGLCSVVTLIFGSLFKIMHWPGASVLLCLGILSLGFIFMPLMALLKTKEATGSTSKLTMISGGILGLLLCVAVIGAVTRMPGAREGIYWLIAIGFSMFVFIPLYFFTGIRNAEKRVDTIMTTVLFIGFTCLQFTMIGLRRPVEGLQTYVYFKNDQLLKNMRRGGDTSTTMSQNDLSIAATINNDCEQLKMIILSKDMDTTIIPDDFETKRLFINERSLDFVSTSKAYKLLADLRTAVSKYNEQASANERIPTDHSILIIPDNNLQHTTNFFALNSLTQLQMYVALARHPKNAVAAK